MRGGGGGLMLVFFFQAEDGIRGGRVTGVQTCALPISADVVSHVQAACNKVDLPVPTLVSESGRAIAAHHSVLVLEVRSEERRVGKEGRARWPQLHDEAN